MVLDTVIAIVAGLAQLVTAWLGYRVSARPIPAEDKRRHRIYETVFIVTGVVGAATVIYNGVSLSKTLSDITGSQHQISSGITQVIQNTKQPPVVNVPPPQVTTSPTQIKRAHVTVSKLEFSPIGDAGGYVNVWHKNQGEIDALTKGSVTVLFPKVPKDAKMQGEMEDTFFAQMLQLKAYETAPTLSLPPGSDPQFSSAPTVPPDRALMPQLLSGQYEVLVMGRFSYTDKTHVQRHTDYCAYIQQNPHPVFYCQRHNEAP